MVELCRRISLLPMPTCRTGTIPTCRRQFCRRFLICRQTGVASHEQHSAGPGPGTCYPHGGRYDCHGFRQSGTDRVSATDSMPSCDICLRASIGRRVQSTFTIIDAADFDVAASFRSGRFFLPCLPSLGSAQTQRNQKTYHLLQQDYYFF